MRKHLQILRNVKRQADLRMGEVFSSILFKLDEPAINALQEKFECRCQYCKLQIEYTYYCMRKKKNPVRAHYVIKARELKLQKDALVKQGMVTQEHAEQAKRRIGAHFYRFKDRYKD